MRNLLLAIVLAVVAAAFLTFGIEATGLDHLVRSVVFSSEESFWLTIAGIFLLNIIGTFLAEDRE